MTAKTCRWLLAEIISRTANGSHANVQQEKAERLLREVEVVGVRFGCVRERAPLNSVQATSEHNGQVNESLMVR